MISSQRNAPVVRHSGLHRGHIGVPPCLPVSGQKRRFEMQADGCKTCTLQQRGEEVHLITQHLRLPIADLGNGLKCCPRVLHNLIPNGIQLNTRRDRLFSEGGNGGESTALQQQSPAHSSCVGHLGKSFLSQPQGRVRVSCAR